MVVGSQVRQEFDMMPPAADDRPGTLVYCDHYLDDILVVKDGEPQWLGDCMSRLSVFMIAQGYVVLVKTTLDPSHIVR